MGVVQLNAVVDERLIIALDDLAQRRMLVKKRLVELAIWSLVRDPDPGRLANLAEELQRWKAGELDEQAHGASD